MRTLRIILEETDLDKRTCYRAEHTITATELLHYSNPYSLLAFVIKDLEKALNEEIKKP